LKRRFLLAVLLVPVISLTYIVADGLSSNHLTWQHIAERIQIEGLLLAFSLRAVVQGRYPTVVEMLRTASPIEYLISVGLIWLLASAALFLAWNVLISWLKRPALLRIRSRFRSRDVLGVIAIVAILLVLFRLQPSPAARITVNLNSVLGPVPEHQRGFSQGGESEMMQPGYFENAMKFMQPIEPRWIRIDHIYDYYGVYQIDAAGKPIYNWRELDRVVDAILMSGAQPLISISYLPPALSSGNVYAPPTDFGQWQELVYQTVYHFNVERKLGIRYWEVWNEPNLPLFWNGTLDDYLHLYEATAYGALRADPSIEIGGPATASFDRWLEGGEPFYEQNWINELTRYTQAHKLQLDFVSWHYYDAQPENFAWSVQVHQQWAAQFKPMPELLLTEWNWSAAPAPELDSEVTAAYAAAVLTTLADTPLDKAFFFEPIDSSTTWAGRWGLMRKDGVIKPVYNTFRLASNVKGQRLAVSGNQPDVGVYAAQDGNKISLLVWRYEYQSTLAQVELTFTGMTTTVNYQTYGADGALLNEGHTQKLALGQWGMSIDLPFDAVRLITMTQ
jgi:xylan 1,4-beta-xylosidase